MVEREIETTVAVEKEREVTETYIDDETVTETVHFCDACGEACDERGGHKTIRTSGDTLDTEAYRDRIASRVEDYAIRAIREEFTHPGDVTEFEQIGNATFRPEVEYREYEEWVSGENVIQRSTETVGTAIEKARQGVVVPPAIRGGETYDICAECEAALGVTRETLDTASYETVEHDESPGRFDSIVGKTMAVADAVLSNFWAIFWVCMCMFQLLLMAEHAVSGKHASAFGLLALASLSIVFAVNNANIE